MRKKEPESELTHFERARVIGARALQLSMGAPPLVKNVDDTISPIRMAFAEYEKGAIPLSVIHEPAVA